MKNKSKNLTYSTTFGVDPDLFTKKNPQVVELVDVNFSEREGFEPPEPCSSTVFKTAAIDHSAISP